MPSFNNLQNSDVEFKENDFTSYTGMRTEFEKLTGIPDSKSLNISSIWYMMAIFALLFLFLSIANGILSLSGNIFLSFIIACCVKSASDEGDLESKRKSKRNLNVNSNVDENEMLTVDEMPVPGERL